MRNSSLTKLIQLSSNMSKPSTSLDVTAHVLVQGNLVHRVHHDYEVAILASIAEGTIAMAATFGADSYLVLITALDGILDMINSGRQGNSSRSVGQAKVVRSDFLGPLG